MRATQVAPSTHMIMGCAPPLSPLDSFLFWMYYFLIWKVVDLCALCWILIGCVRATNSTAAVWAGGLLLLQSYIAVVVVVVAVGLQSVTAAVAAAA